METVGPRHVQTRNLWVQQRVQEEDFRLKKEPGDTNLTDALTNPLDEGRMTNLLKAVGHEFRDGSGNLERECRAVVDGAYVELGVVLGWWNADHRQTLTGKSGRTPR